MNDEFYQFELDVDFLNDQERTLQGGSPEIFKGEDKVDWYKPHGFRRNTKSFEEIVKERNRHGFLLLGAPLEGLLRFRGPGRLVAKLAELDADTQRTREDPVLGIWNKDTGEVATAGEAEELTRKFYEMIQDTQHGEGTVMGEFVNTLRNRGKPSAEGIERNITENRG